jgi:hypothetical protein
MTFVRLLFHHRKIEETIYLFIIIFLQCNFFMFFSYNHLLINFKSMYDYSMRVNSSFFNKYVVICYWFNKLLGTFYVITNPTGLLFNTSFHWSKKYYANARKHRLLFHHRKIEETIYLFIIIFLQCNFFMFWRKKRINDSLICVLSSYF